MEDPQALGWRLHRARQEQGLTLQQLSERTGLSVSYISQLEHGSRLNPSRQTVVLVSEGLGLRPGALMEELSALAVVATEKIGRQFEAYWRAQPESEQQRLGVAAVEQRVKLVGQFLLARFPTCFPDLESIARALGVSLRHVQQVWAHGSEMGIVTLGRLAEVTGVPLSFFVTGRLGGPVAPAADPAAVSRYLLVIQLALDRRISPEQLEAMIRSKS